MLACGRPRQLHFGITAVLVSEQEVEDLASQIRHILLSRAVTQGYIILQSRINKPASSPISDSGVKLVMR